MRIRLVQDNAEQDVNWEQPPRVGDEVDFRLFAGFVQRVVWRGSGVYVYIGWTPPGKA